MPRKNLLLGRGLSGSGYGGGFGSGGSGSSSRVYTGTQAEKLAQARADDLTPEQPNSRKEATRELVRLLTTDDPKAQAAGKKAAAEGGFDVKTAAALGAMLPVEGKSITDRALKVAGPLLKAIEIIGRPQQAVMELIQAGAQDTGLDKVINGQAFLPESQRPTELVEGPGTPKLPGDGGESGGYRDAWRALKGEKRWDPVSQSYTHDLQYVAALGANPDHIGKVGNVAGFIGGAALDPLNFVGAGEARTAAKVGEKGAALLADDAARELTPALARQLERQGVEAGAEKIAPEALQQALKRTGIRAGTTDAQRAAIRQTLIDEAQAGAGRTTKGVVSEGAKTVSLKEDRLIRKGVRALTGKGERTGAEKVAEDAIDSAMRYDRGGLRVAGRSLLPEGVRAPIRGLVKDDIRQVGSKFAESAVLTDRAAKVAKLDSIATRATERSDEFATAAGAATDATEAEKLLRVSEMNATRAVTTAAKADALRATDDVTKLMSLDHTLGNVQTPVTEIVPRKIKPDFHPVAGLKDTLKDAFINRAGIKGSRSLVPGTADAVRESQVVAAGTTKAIAEQGRRLMNQAAEAVSGVPPETQLEILKALDIGGSLDEILPTLDDVGRRYATKLDEIRKLTYNVNDTHSLSDLNKFRAPDDYMGRYVTKEGAKALEELAKLDPTAYESVRQFHTGKAVTSQGGHKLPRTFMPNTPLVELNDIVSKPLREHGLLKEGVNPLELDPLKILTRRFDQTMPDLQFVKSVEGMSKSVKGTLGEDLVVRVKPGVKVSERDFTRRGLQEIPLDNATSGRVFAHPDIAPEISNLAARTVDDKAVAGFAKTMDQWNRLWKSYATVPIITGSGFHTKNSIGNMFNNHLAGVASYAYKDAFNDQMAIWQAKHAHPDLSVPEALAKNGVNPDRIAKIELALEHQVLDEGFFNTDLHGQASLAIEGKGGRGQRFAAKFDPRNPEQMWGVPTGRKLGEHIEDNARLAHFYSKLDETGNAAQAAASVRKYLFDYGDLTPFERKIMKRVHAFYTFTRKNTPLQFEELVRNPAAVNRLAMLEQATLGGGDGSAGKDVPSFMGDIGGPIGRSQAGLLTGNKNGVVGNIDTPLDAASKTVDPLLFLAGKRSAMDTAQGVLGNVSGGPATAVKTAFEEATGRSAFTGGSLVDLEGKRRKNPVLSATDLFIPAISKGTRTLPALKSLATGEPGGETADSNRLIVIKALTGLGAKEVTPEMQKLARNEKLRSLRDIIDALKAADVDVPTIEELQTIGELEKTPRRKRAG
jgi:hypothetical protein